MKKMKIPRNSYQLYIFFILVVTGCSMEDYEFSEVKYHSISNFDPGFEEYCNFGLTSNFELNAVQSSFYGDYENALEQATKRAPLSSEHSEGVTIESSELDREKLLKAMEGSLNDPNASAESKAAAKAAIEFFKGFKAPEEAFSTARPVSAVQYISSKAKDFHFTLINEAHYNSQNRIFTKELLKPLWEAGYRYLALETLYHTDTILTERGYPTTATGYYTKDSNFGNMVRDAIEIGFKLIPYETQKQHDGTLRDKDQAHNIFRQTLQKDKVGKVLIHAGYSHISEMGGSSYDPMGSQLKKLAKQDILTVDQQNMTGLNDANMLHPFYREVINRFDLSEATVFLDEKGEVIVDPINRSGIDIQVYHPMTVFEKERPIWLKTKGIKSIPLSDEIKSYKGCLIQATNKDETNEAIPLDQFIISEEKELLLPSGTYDLRIINCHGDLVATSKLKVK